MSRHKILLMSIQPLPEEIQSYNTAILLMCVPLPVVTVAALLDWGLHKLYMDKFHPWVELLREIQVIYFSYFTANYLLFNEIRRSR